MSEIELSYLQDCKLLIEEKLKWINSNEWKQRDYLHLIELVENKSGITLSLSTVKRIWKKYPSNIPHISTLDALAQFLDYDDWLHFKQSNQKIAASKITNTSKRLTIIRPVLFSILIFCLALVSILFLKSIRSEAPKSGIVYEPVEIEFSCKYSAVSELPNTVIFNYDVSTVEADSFFIQQSWNNFQRDRIQKTKNNLTSVYYYPGYHHAKLIANDSVIKQSVVRIITDNWVPMGRYGYMDEIPVYIGKNDVVNNGVLFVTKNHLNKSQIEINNNTLVSYYYINEFKNLSSGDFGFETKVKCDSIFNYSCPHLTICIIGQDDMNVIPLTSKGCIGNASVKMGDVTVDGKNNDLSLFGCNVYEWQKIALYVKNGIAIVFINDEEVLKVPFNTNVGNIVGFNFNFSGTGLIDYVKLSDTDGKIIYSTEFESL
jgi:hypothetical protein